jgi:hypothetical protein
MKSLVISGLVGAIVGVAVMRPDTIARFYDQVFPVSAAKEQALTLCFHQNHDFDRLAADQRAACYAQFLPAEAEDAGAPAATDSSIGLQKANFVDLWRDAGQGAMPKNDIRAQEETARVTHPASARLAR